MGARCPRSRRPQQSRRRTSTRSIWRSRAASSNLVRAGRDDLAPETAGVHEFFLDGKLAGGDGEVRSEEVDRAGGTVGNLGRLPPARLQNPKTSATVSSEPAEIRRATPCPSP